MEQDVLRKLLRDPSQCLSASSVASELGLSHAQAERILSNLERKSLVRQDSLYDCYRVTAKGIDAVERRFKITEWIPLGAVVAAVISALATWSAVQLNQKTLEFNQETFRDTHYAVLNLDCGVEAYPSVSHISTYGSVPRAVNLRRIVDFYRIRSPFVNGPRYRYRCLLQNSGTGTASDARIIFFMHYLRANRQVQQELFCEMETVPPNGMVLPYGAAADAPITLHGGDKWEFALDNMTAAWLLPDPPRYVIISEYGQAATVPLHLSPRTDRANYLKPSAPLAAGDAFRMDRYVDEMQRRENGPPPDCDYRAPQMSGP